MFAAGQHPHLDDPADDEISDFAAIPARARA